MRFLRIIQIHLMMIFGRRDHRKIIEK